MIATDAEHTLEEESELDETDFEFSTAIRLQFKDANDFGRACRSLAIPARRRRQEIAAV